MRSHLGRSLAAPHPNGTTEFLRWRIAISAVPLFLAALFIAGPARAGDIDSYGGASGGGTATVNGQSYIPYPSFPTPYPNNAGPGGAGGQSGNVLDVSKNFTSFKAIDMSFHATDHPVPNPNPPPATLPGYTSYLFDEDVTNNTAFVWTDFHIQLGFGTGAGFVQAGGGSQLQFDPSFPADSDVFPTVVETPYKDSFFDGLLPPGGTAIFEVQVTVPDTALANAPAAAKDAGGGGYTFTVREFPSVPEPSSLACLGVASLIGLARRRSGGHA